MPRNPLRAGLYDRVSTERQKTARQARENREAAEANGWKIVATYGETGGASASRFARGEREGWAQLRADVLSGKLDVVILWEPSRGDRKLPSWAAFLDDARDQGVLIHITKDDATYDVRKNRDWKDLAKEGIDSAAESNMLSTRILSGVADAALNGVPYGPVPYGYRRWYEGSGKARIVHQELDLETAPIAREIITAIASSVPVIRIQDDLADRGIVSPTGRPRWARVQITRMVLSGVVYIAKRRHNGGPLLDGRWPPLVDEDVYWRAVAVLKDPARKTQVWGGGIRPGRATYLLSYIASCDKCGAPLNVTKSNWPEPYYRCSAGRGGCAYAPVAWMDEAIMAAVVKVCSDPEVFRGITSGDDAAAQAARDEAREERSRLESFRAAAVAKQITPEDFAAIARGINAQIAELDAKATELSTAPAVRDLVAGPEAERWKDIAARWAGMPVPARRSVVSALFEIRLAPAGKGTGRLRDPFRIKLEQRVSGAS